MAVEIGELIAHYRILEKIGEGGMGTVYRAEDTKLERAVALKVLPEAFGEDPERLARFEREAKLLAALDHPNIVTIHSIEEADGARFLVMRLVEGEALARAIPTGGLPLPRFFSIAGGLAEAVAAAHDAGVVHRDLKPANVMVGPDDRVQVLDFGLGKRVDHLAADSASPTEAATRHGAVLGTLQYMSPEQARGEPVDARSDIFSLGAILFEMATGRRAFAGESATELGSAILRDTPPAVDALRPEAPRHLARIIRRCLEKKPDHRYQSARDVVNELADLERELTSAASPASEVPPPSPPRRLPRVGTWMVVAAVVLGVAWLAVRLAGRSEGPTEVGAVQALAVLPFANLMDDPEQDYLVEGIHEALITDLSKVDPLRVISSSSAMRFRDSDLTLPEIARELDVDVLVEGSVLRSGERVRINAQLIDGRTDENLWAESFDRDLEDLFALLSEVAAAISARIEIVLAPEEIERLDGGAVSLEAQEAYLRAKHLFRRFRGARFRDSLELLERAVELEPDFARAWGGKAAAHMILAAFRLAPAETHVPMAREAARRALALEPGQADALTARGWVSLYFDWDWEAAKRDFERALESNPNQVDALHGLAELALVHGELERNVALMRRARRIDPVSATTMAPFISHLIMAGHYAEALAELDAAASLDLPSPVVSDLRMSATWELGRREEAVRYLIDRLAEPETRRAVERGLAAGGPTGAQRALAEALARLPESRRDPLAVAAAFARAGERDAAFEWLEAAYAERRPQLFGLRVEPDLKSLAGDPRFADLARRIGLPDLGGE